MRSLEKLHAWPGLPPGAESHPHLLGAEEGLRRRSGCRSKSPMCSPLALQAGLRAELNKVHEATRKEATPAERTAERRAAALARSRRAAAFAPKAHKGEREELL